MAEYILENEELKVTFNSHGAELRSVVDKKTGYEYMWQADPAFWGRTSPVLFPVVGNYRDRKTVYKGKEYFLSQHGFARDSEFEMRAAGDNGICFKLTESPETLENYPFEFELYIRYILDGRKLYVNWKVKNTNDEEMYFSIGAHPAFNANLDTDELLLDTSDIIVSEILTKGGTVSKRTKTLPVKDGKLKMSDELFSEDALIIYRNDMKYISVLENGEREKVRVEFEAPVVGIWSPVGKHAPFVCIEPWYGRADREDYDYQLENREYGNTLSPGETFEKGYNISFF